MNISAGRIKLKIIKTELIEGDYWKVKALNKSFLADFAKSPAHAFTYKETKAKDSGTMFHEYVLEPEIFNNKYIVKPDDMNLAATKKDSRVLPFIKSAKGKKIITQKEMNSFDKMKENLLNYDFLTQFNNYKFGDIINNSIIEQGIVADVELDDLVVSIKIKPDIIFHHETYEGKKEKILFDIKTVENANSLNKIKWDFINYKYHWQDQLYSLIAEEHYKQPVKFIFVLVEKQRPHGIRYIQLSTLCLQDIEKVIYEYHSWELAGGDRSICYKPVINTIDIGV